MQREHGSEVVWRRCGRRYTSIAALKKVGVTVPEATDPHVERRLAALEAQIKQANQRADALAQSLIEFRQKAHAWFKRHEK
jgi:hypothetical protein